MNTKKIAFFGGEPLAVPTLNVLKKHDILPSLIICNPDRPVGRKQILTPPPAKIWAEENGIKVFQPTSLKNRESLALLLDQTWDLFIVVAYNQIMPKYLLEFPEYGTVNVHPSLLPKLRGASPIRSAILQDMHTTGVTIMLMDEKLDHGPILAQEIIDLSDRCPVKGRWLDTLLAEKGAELLAVTLPQWLNGDIVPTEQNHEQATHCGKITKNMGEISLQDDPYQNYLKYCAYDGWPGIFYFDERGKRVKITEARFEKGKFILEKIVPEGGKEIMV